MPYSVHIAQLQHQIDTQLELAGLAACDSIRAMHEDLEKLYRARLVAVMMAQRLATIDPARLPETRPVVRQTARRTAGGAWPITLSAAYSVTLPV